MSPAARPLSVPHESREDYTIGDYHVSSGTLSSYQSFKDAACIQMSGRVGPRIFQPERFLTELQLTRM